MVRQVTEQMNSDMFDAIIKASYNVSEFTRLEKEQAKESFMYNGYKVYENDNELSVKKIN